MIGVRTPNAEVDDYVLHGGDEIVYGDSGELILEEVNPRRGFEPATTRVMAVFAPGQWVSAKQMA